MKTFSAFVVLAFCMATVGCEPEEQYHARMLGGNLRSLQKRWNSAGRPSTFEPTNYYYIGWTTNQFFCFTNQVYAEGVLYNCRFAIRSPDQFESPGLLTITDEGVLLWLGESGKIVVSPDAKRWSSSRQK